MGTLTVRKLDTRIIDRLKARARTRGHSLESELRDLHEIIESGVIHGWHSFEQSLIRLFKESKITEETAMLYSVNKPSMRKAIDVAKKQISPDDDSPSDFRLNLDALHHGA